MAGFQITGKITKIYPTTQATESFKKRELVLEDDSNPQYPEYVVIQFIQDKCSLLDGYREGDRATVDFNIKGRAYQKGLDPTKYFTQLQGWKISGTGTGSGQPAVSAANQNSPATQYDTVESADPYDDDLPF